MIMNTLLITAMFASMLGSNNIGAQTDTINRYMVDGKLVYNFDGSQLESKMILSYDIKVEPETKEKLKRFVKLWDEQSKLNKAIKEERLALIDKTKVAIENLSDEEVEHFLHKKWIDPVMEGINGTLTSVLGEMEKRIASLARKYAISYNELGQQLAVAQKELSDLLADLTGDELSLEGLQQLNK